MDISNERPDYSIERISTDKYEDCKDPKIKSAVLLEVQSSEVRCMKGDCNQDYAPG